MPTTNNEPLIPRVLHEIKRTFMGEAHSLWEIKAGLEQAETQETDFFYLLKRHHDYLQESITVLLDNYAEEFDKQWHLSRFLHLLSMHSRAEQETLYRNLSANREKEARLQGIEGRHEHDMAYQLSEELYGLGFEDKWSEEIDGKAIVLAHMVSHHLKEEETQMFPIAERCLEEKELSGLLIEYIHKCEGYLEIEMRPGYRL